MRGVSDGGDGNHSGPLPSVGTYLDEQPITTIGGTLDIHIYDIARVEVLPGPQGTLYGASSESGTLRIITNKPTTAGFSGGHRPGGQLPSTTASEGYVFEGFVNVPLTSYVADPPRRLRRARCRLHRQCARARGRSRRPA